MQSVSNSFVKFGVPTFPYFWDSRDSQEYFCRDCFVTPIFTQGHEAAFHSRRHLKLFQEEILISDTAENRQQTLKYNASNELLVETLRAVAISSSFTVRLRNFITCNYNISQCNNYWINL